ncbi:MAG: acylphosphatase [Acidimicrobiia bacterium]|nr:MAG: acylphosphatase [Acidimicrobiia bacterium]
MSGPPAGADPVRVRVVVTGRVQGVWFRDTCRERARREGVAGWVRNRPDGAVEAELEGPPAAVARLVEWCREGPPRARVDAVEVTDLPPRGERGFRVR